MEHLPPVIIDIILEFQGYHRFRNGKYITRLYLEHEKYDKVKTKPIIQRYKEKMYKTRFQKMNCTYILSTSIYSNKIHWFMDIYSNNNYSIEKSYHYVYGHNDKQHLPVTSY